MSQAIAATIDGTLVQGVITYHDAYDITVQITKPFSGFSAGCHIPCLARQYIDYKGRKGLQKAIELLTGLYEDLKIIHTNTPKTV